MKILKRIPSFLVSTFLGISITFPAIGMDEYNSHSIRPHFTNEHEDLELLETRKSTDKLKRKRVTDPSVNPEKRQKVELSAKQVVFEEPLPLDEFFTRVDEQIAANKRKKFEESFDLGNNSGPIEAERLFNDALNVVIDLKDWKLQLNTLDRLAALNTTRSSEYLLRTLLIARKYGELETEAKILIELGSKESDAERAYGYLCNAHFIAENLPNWRLDLNALKRLGKFNDKRAREHLRNAFQIAQQHNDWTSVTEILSQLRYYHAKLNK